MKCFLAFLFCCYSFTLQAQYDLQDIQSDFTKSERRIRFDDYLRRVTLKEDFFYSIDEESLSVFESSMLSATQFLISNENVKSGINKMIAGYNRLDYSSKRALLAAIYALYPSAYYAEMNVLLKQEKNIKLFAIESVYLSRLLSNSAAKESFFSAWKSLSVQHLEGADSSPVMQVLWDYLRLQAKRQKQLPPKFSALFSQQKRKGIKTVYAFQRWNRDYPGLSVIQMEDGHFVRDSSGKVAVFRQLARAATNLPYFLTNGNTPQGIFRIYATGKSRNLLIGPTPNLQMVMPWEKDSVYYDGDYDFTVSALDNYLDQLPKSWQSYMPMQEAFWAGKCGRSEIIAHGGTANPQYFKNYPFYPMAPTDGCLCGLELWNEENGRLEKSDQLRMVNAYLQTPQRRGLLMVINLDDKQLPVSAAEVQRIVNAWELN